MPNVFLRQMTRFPTHGLISPCSNVFRGPKGFDVFREVVESDVLPE
jgi:hypothetical protein